MLSKWLKAWGWWLAGATTVVLALFLYSRAQLLPDADGVELDVGDTLG